MLYGIAFKTEEEAKKALTDLKAKKADFRKMANEKSLDNQNGDGFLGTVTKGDLVAAFDTAVFELEENAYCDKVLPLDAELADGTTAKYYYVIKATNFAPAKSMSFDNVKDELKNNNFDIEIKN